MGFKALSSRINGQLRIMTHQASEQCSHCNTQDKAQNGNPGSPGEQRRWRGRELGKGRGGGRNPFDVLGHTCESSEPENR